MPSTETALVGRRAFLSLVSALSLTSIFIAFSGCGEEQPPAQPRATKPLPPRPPDKSSPASGKPKQPANKLETR
jgi:hypothetical protein